LEGREEALTAEWAGLDGLLDAVERPEGSAAMAEAIRARNAELCEGIRAGEMDSEAVFAHVRRTVAEKLRASDPGLLKRSEGSGPG
jgi:hypothetical protein